MTAPILTLQDIAYTYASGTATDVVSLPSSDVGDVMFFAVCGDTLVADSNALTAAGWYVDFNGPAAFSGQYLIEMWRICDGSEGATESTLLGGSGGNRLYAIASFTPSAALPPADNLYILGSDPGWDSNVTTGAGPDAPFDPNSDVYTGAGGISTFPGVGPCYTGFDIGFNFLISPGGTITNDGIILIDESWTNPLDAWTGDIDIRADRAVSLQWYNSTSGDPSAEFTTDLWHSTAGSWYVAVDQSLSQSGDCDNDPFPMLASGIAIPEDFNVLNWF